MTMKQNNVTEAGAASACSAKNGSLAGPSALQDHSPPNCLSSSQLLLQPPQEFSSLSQQVKPVRLQHLEWTQFSPSHEHCTSSSSSSAGGTSAGAASAWACMKEL